ncbi:MAG: hypothetical protein JRM99_09055 [Nitrososphaerota archaeon]|nr:hypothetical protein [Nitrososphaerota archaeon]
MPSKMSSKMESLSFLLGDWRGTGVMTFSRERPVVVEYEHRRMCKLTPDGSQIEFVEFSDDSKKERMFHGEHSFIYVDSSSGELRLRRHTFLDSEDRGYFVTEERVEVAKDGSSASLRSVDESGKSPIHQGTVQKVSGSELKVTGKIIVGKRTDPYEIRLVRREAKK